VIHQAIRFELKVLVHEDADHKADPEHRDEHPAAISPAAPRDVSAAMAIPITRNRNPPTEPPMVGMTERYLRRAFS